MDNENTLTIVLDSKEMIPLNKVVMATRIINPIFGGHIIFCVDRYDEGSTMEQLDLKTVKAVIDNLKKIM